MLKGDGRKVSPGNLLTSRPPTGMAVAHQASRFCDDSPCPREATYLFRCKVSGDMRKVVSLTSNSRKGMLFEHHAFCMALALNLRDWLLETPHFEPPRNPNPFADENTARPTTKFCPARRTRDLSTVGHVRPDRPWQLDAPSRVMDCDRSDDC